MKGILGTDICVQMLRVKVKKKIGRRNTQVKYS